ncbi:hypothetical protein N7510_005663 [Penicillium lagena]|uniref:uncharacterized protein n=1 Tax=Penicillium lagena TaxID=94218 RepID=UPI0025422594|nr:uncharacterized protein N7510_005663 [Penicillium lagena]KAJ5612469.1 hypothetical protein N7510_005663 [Penicillium lagena]
MSDLPTFKPALILHGGAGNIQRSKIPPDLYASYHASLQSFLRSTYALLNEGASALDAAVHCVSLLEDDELFNSGRGSVFTKAGTIEMEASVMVTSLRDDPNQEGQGAIKRGAGVMGIRNVRNPIRLARESLLRSGVTADGEPSNDGGCLHSQLVGPHVEKMASEWGLKFEPDEYFRTQRRWDEHRRGLKGEEDPIFMSQGTVGCVCLDQWGNLAVATSTGGMTNKLPGRIGDTPTLGTGFWAESWEEASSGTAGSGDSNAGAFSVNDLVQEARSCMTDCFPGCMRDSPSPSLPVREHSASEKAPLLYQGAASQHRTKKRAIAVSGTGNGDSFLRVAASRTAAAMLRFGSSDKSLADAVTAVAGPGGDLQRSAGPRWKKTGEGEGGMIGIEADTGPAAADKKLRRGKVVFDFNSGGMWRAWVEEDENGNDVERVMVFRGEYK